MAFYLMLKSSVVVKGGKYACVAILFKGKEGGNPILEFKYKS